MSKKADELSMDEAVSVMSVEEREKAKAEIRGEAKSGSQNRYAAEPAQAAAPQPPKPAPAPKAEAAPKHVPARRQKTEGGGGKIATTQISVTIPLATHEQAVWLMENAPLVGRWTLQRIWSEGIIEKVERMMKEAKK